MNRRRRNWRRRRWSRCRWWRPVCLGVRRRRRGGFALLTFLRDYDTNYHDDNEQQDQQQNDHDYHDNPNRKTRFLFSFRLGLLTALNQPVYFRVLRKHPLYFFKLRNRRRVKLVPVIVQSLMIDSVGRTEVVTGTGALHILHHRV